MAEQYQIVAMKVANILMASDNDFDTNSITSYSTAIRDFAELISSSYNQGVELDLSSNSILESILPDISSEVLQDLVEANTANNYAEVIDAQLLTLSANANGLLESNTSDGSQLIAIQISGSFDEQSEYQVTLTGGALGNSITSSELVSFGQNVAVFRFNDVDLRALGDGGIVISATNVSTGEQLTVVNEFSLDVQQSTTLPTLPGGGGGGEGRRCHHVR